MIRLKDILGGMEPSQFLPEVLLPGQLRNFSGVFNLNWRISFERLEDFIKNPTHQLSIQRFYQGQFFPLIPHAVPQEHFYQVISPLHGKDLLKAITKNDCSIHLQNIFSFWPELKALNLDLFKYTPFGGQSYMVVSHNVPVSSFGHHTDPMDLFAIQLYGCKRWKIALDSEGKPFCPVEPGIPYDPLNPSQKYQEFVLRPGDVLFVPFQVPHYVEQVDEGPSVHLVLGITRNFKMQLNNYLDLLIKGQVFDQTSPYDLRDQSVLFENDLKKFELKLKKFAEDFNHQNVLKTFLANADSYHVMRSKKG